MEQLTMSIPRDPLHDGRKQHVSTNTSLFRAPLHWPTIWNHGRNLLEAVDDLRVPCHGCTHIVSRQEALGLAYGILHPLDIQIHRELGYHPVVWGAEARITCLASTWEWANYW